jgi:WD40 repeat protein
VWDAGTGRELLTLAGHSGSVGSCAWSPDGQRIVSGSGDETLRVWDAVSGKCLYRIHHLPGGELARINGESKEVLGVSTGAWRYLEWVQGKKLSVIRLLPAEYFGLLPLDQSYQVPIA